MKIRKNATMLFSGSTGKTTIIHERVKYTPEQFERKFPTDFKGKLTFFNHYLKGDNPDKTKV